ADFDEWEGSENREPGGGDQAGDCVRAGGSAEAWPSAGDGGGGERDAGGAAETLARGVNRFCARAGDRRILRGQVCDQDAVAGCGGGDIVGGESAEGGAGALVGDGSGSAD